MSLYFKIHTALFICCLFTVYPELCAQPSHENELKEIIQSEEEMENLKSIADQNLNLREKNIIETANGLSLDFYNLEKAKYNLISGDLRRAYFFLNRIGAHNRELLPVKKRFLSLIYFLQKEYKKSIDVLNESRFFESENHYSTVCPLMLLNLIGLKDEVGLAKEKNRCLNSNFRFSQNGLLWHQMMIDMNLFGPEEIKQNLIRVESELLQDANIAKIWLEIGLYLGHEQEFLKRVSELPESAFRSKKVREIIGIMNLRIGNYKKAYTFVEDIDSINSYNIKANIELQKKEYELAFGHVLLALEKKADSLNALERYLPLALLLNQWDEGLKLISLQEENNLKRSKSWETKLKILKTLFLLFRNKEGDLTVAYRELKTLDRIHDGFQPFEMTLLWAYWKFLNYSKLDHYEMTKYEGLLEKSCQDFDGLSCYFAMWDLDDSSSPFTKNTTSEVQKRTNNQWPSYQQLINNGDKNAPLKEYIFNNQEDIEELDGFPHPHLTDN